MDHSSATVAHRKKTVSAQQDRIIILCLVSISFVFLLALTNAWPARTHDGLIHMHRIRALADALRTGVLYPRWFPDFTFDYGFPVLNYYPPLFYYPSALLRASWAGNGAEFASPDFGGICALGLVDVSVCARVFSRCGLLSFALFAINFIPIAC